MPGGAWTPNPPEPNPRRQAPSGARKARHPIAREGCHKLSGGGKRVKGVRSSESKKLGDPSARFEPRPSGKCAPVWSGAVANRSPTDPVVHGTPPTLCVALLPVSGLGALWLAAFCHREIMGDGAMAGGGRISR